MKQSGEWNSEIDGKSYHFQWKLIKRKPVLAVNGASIDVPSSFASKIISYDEPFLLDGQEARLVFHRFQPDVVVNGVYLQSGKPYIPRPNWMVVFALICTYAIPISFIGNLIFLTSFISKLGSFSMFTGVFLGSLCGALPFALGGGATALCTYFSKKPFSVAVRISLCIAVTLLWSFLAIAAVYRIYIWSY